MSEIYVQRDSDTVCMYVIYDEKAKRYDIPWFALNDIFAKRRFQIMAMKEETMLNQFTSDYKLFRIGEFGLLDACVDLYQMELIMSGNEINKK